VRQIISWLLAGMLIGAIATGVWWWQRTSAIERQLTEQTQRTAEMESKLARAEARMNQLTKDLDVEKSVRHGLEDIVGQRRR
jgi:hypothetical protein